MKVTMKNAKTGELRDIKVGWSWVLFLFSGFFGLPLFLRKLNVWGAVFLTLWVTNFIAPAVTRDQDRALGVQLLMFLTFLGLEIWIGIKGNEMTAKNYLENSWVFVNPDDEVTKMAKAKWGISV